MFLSSNICCEEKEEVEDDVKYFNRKSVKKENVRVKVVGSFGVGKTCLMKDFKAGGTHVSFDNEFDCEIVFAQNFDDVDVVILIFSLVERRSLYELLSWTDRFPKETPRLIVGSKGDLLLNKQYSDGGLVIPQDEYIDIARQLGAKNFLPVSSLHLKEKCEGVRQVFEECAKIKVKKEKYKSVMYSNRFFSGIKEFTSGIKTLLEGSSSAKEDDLSITSKLPSSDVRNQIGLKHRKKIESDDGIEIIESSNSIDDGIEIIE